MTYTLCRMLTLLALFALLSSVTMRSRAQQQASPAVPPVVTPSPKPVDQTGNQEGQASSQTTTSNQDVVRINTQLVQLDAVVTDKKGRHVTDLTQADFELLIDGKKQELTHFTHINLPGKIARELPKRKKNDAAAPEAMPTRELDAKEVRRTMAFVVDDLGLGFASAERVKETLRKFVAEQMQEGDLVAILRTGSGLGLLEQFTSDKRILYGAIERLVWNPLSRDMSASYGDGSAEVSDEQATANGLAAQFDEYRTTNFTTGTIGATSFVIESLRSLPGRKSVILLSDGFRVYSQSGDDSQTQQIIDAMQRLVEQAGRSSVVIYAIDAKGLQPFMPGGETGGRANLSASTDAQQSALEALDGPIFLANQTGGFVVKDSNDLNIGIQEALYDQQQYYLLGFDPDDATFDQKYHKIKIKLTRPGLTIRTRSSFFGAADAAPTEAPKAAATRGDQLLAALLAPLGNRALTLKLTPYFFSSAKSGPLVRALFHIDCSKLTFKELADGKRQLKLDLAAFAFDEAGATADLSANVIQLSFTPAQHAQVLRYGLAYRRDFALKKPGPYQFRAVIRDDASGQTGSASQFIRVPNLANKQLALSGLVLTVPKESSATTAATAASGTPAITPGNPTVSAQVENGKNTEAASQPYGLPGSPYVRTFASAGALQYGAAIYNALTDKKTGKTQLTMQVEVYRAGKVFRQLSAHPIEPPPNVSATRFDYVGQLKFNNFPAGEYLLRMVVTDGLAKKKVAQAEQWMDFRVE